MVPLLVQLRTLNVLQSSSSSLDDQHHIYIEREFLSEGVEDSAILGSALVWREKEFWKLCLDGNVYAIDESEAMVVINKADKSINIAGKTMEPVTSAETIATVEVLRGMLEHQNQPAAVILAESANHSVLSKDLLIAACMHGPAALVDKIMEANKIDLDYSILHCH